MMPSRRHIKKYEFKNILQDSQEQFLPQEIPVSGMEPQEEPILNAEPNLQKELIEKLLQKSDELSTSLASLELKFQKQEEEFGEALKSIKESSYNEGFLCGEKKVREELEVSVLEQKKALADSIKSLDEQIKINKEYVDSLRADLSTIAMDMAREVINKEIEQNSSQIALSLARDFISMAGEALDITVRLNPQDLDFVRENILDSRDISFLADSAISKGGVVLMSSSGNFDGNLMHRYKNLKKSILEEN